MTSIINSMFSFVCNEKVLLSSEKTVSFAGKCISVINKTKESAVIKVMANQSSTEMNAFIEARISDEKENTKFYKSHLFTFSKEAALVLELIEDAKNGTFLFSPKT